MNSRWNLLVAAGITFLGFEACTLFSALRNFREPATSRLLLTDRELRRVDLPGESSAVLLDLNWDTDSNDDHPRHRPGWLDRAKLESLGFDCRVSPDAPFARQHYESQLPLRVFLVLTLVVPEATTSKPGVAGNRLRIIDAGLDPAELRLRYPNTQTHALIHGTVRPEIRNENAGPPPDPRIPVLHGWLAGPQPSAIFVPAPLGKQLAVLAPKRDSGAPEDSTTTNRRSPTRWTATVAWGPRFEPWIENCQGLSGDAALQ
ncbi:MAG: DUF4824 family protein [Verrucomicrobiales bacterium]|nr:DUF4824 family protein [Verrucomicrobiales bacterium]